jgi:glycosyltransferase involved in cell wall biosynthesis
MVCSSVVEIVHIIESTATGTLSIAQMAANEQAKNSDVTVIFSRRPDTPKNIETLFSKRVRIVEENLQVKNFPFSFFALRKHLKVIKPDVIHCHSSFAGFVGRLAALGLKTKVFYSPHCISFMRKDISKTKAWLFKLFELAACIKSSTFIACSESERLAIKNALPFAKVALLENAVDLSDFTQTNAQTKKTENENIKVITVGGIRPQKGPAEYAQIATQFKDRNIDFIWIGGGDAEHKKALLSAGVTVTGWMPREQVIAELYKADVYVSTALWEGMPVSVIEACAANLPVIVRNCAGNRDIVEHGINGSLFSETAQCVDLLNLYLNAPANFEPLVNVASQQVFDRFSTERFTKELELIYKK